MMESFKIKVRQVVLVGGFYKEIDSEGKSKRMLPDSFDWQAVKAKAGEIIMINSDNDPWGCTDELARGAAIELDAKMVVNSGEGHMGSGAFNQPYREFKLLKRILLALSLIHISEPTRPY